MRLDYTAETERFRAGLRDWLSQNRPSTDRMRQEPSLSSAHIPGWAAEWQRRLFDAGWLVPGWPPERGGRNASPVEQLVYHEELARLRLLRTYNPQGLSIIVPSIVDHGSEYLREKYVVPSLRADLSWCLGMSEPGAGSDLAGLRTRAEVYPDHFVVTGQKVWTSGAHHADLCFCFVRTDPDAPKHRGISVLILDMKAPGVEVRPLADLTDPQQTDFTEVFLDGVVVPRDHLVGELNDGWRISAGSLAHERGMMWLNAAARLDEAVEGLLQLCQSSDGRGGRHGDDSGLREEFARLYVDAQAMRFMGYRGFAKFAKGQAAPEHSVLKLFGSEAEQRATRLATEILGAEALDAPSGGRGYDGSSGDVPWMTRYLRSYAMTISAGTSEIQRNIIAQRVLGLPRR